MPVPPFIYSCVYVVNSCLVQCLCGALVGLACWPVMFFSWLLCTVVEPLLPTAHASYFSCEPGDLMLWADLFHWYMAGDGVIHILAEGFIIHLNSYLVVVTGVIHILAEGVIIHLNSYLVVVTKEVIIELKGFLFHCFPVHLGPLLDCALWFPGLLMSDAGVHYYYVVVRNGEYHFTRHD